MSNQTQVKKLKKRSPPPEDYVQTTYVTPTYASPIYPVYTPYKPPAHFTSQLESLDTALFASPTQTAVQTPVTTTSERPDSFEHPNQALYAKPKRIAAHVLNDGYYRILEDEMETTRYGLQRSLVLEPTSPNSFKTWIPKSCETPLVSLVGFTVLKSTMESDHPAPYYGKNYSLSFH